MAILSEAAKRILPILSASGLLFASFSSPAFAQGAEDVIRVFMNHARIIKIDRNISKVIIGSSDVADVAVADSNTIVLTGKSYGTTNLVILDEQGEAIVDERILVSVDEANTLRVYKQTGRAIYSCTPYCEEHAGGAGTTTGTP
ncbi:pilus assembly protein N-terminal domain-containing protein [Pseudohoeflea coraliihabitans]|uniref:Pilus assembly protein N-terminal domain-containing protein n=1 Tax=Pseudohoeflea coraliihabitans TaxID=2860393 RepID=A0ABS6WQ74_9HYPH|nr:pilus assembly protein N-terminal domain-containing protein [Pseudohoeflea sp. DP4N28-3]MBW3097788.1 pilus assembly protein N-terminal domain-containing protein [Pseudohoeflea sp. DP4N28-3]